MDPSPLEYFASLVFTMVGGILIYAAVILVAALGAAALLVVLARLTDREWVRGLWRR